MRFKAHNKCQPCRIIVENIDLKKDGPQQGLGKSSREC